MLVGLERVFLKVGVQIKVLPWVWRFNLFSTSLWQEVSNW